MHDVKRGLWTMAKGQEDGPVGTLKMHPSSCLDNLQKIISTQVKLFEILHSILVID